jgi:hypothetical protein
LLDASPPNFIEPEKEEKAEIVEGIVELVDNTMTFKDQLDNIKEWGDKINNANLQQSEQTIVDEQPIENQNDQSCLIEQFEQQNMTPIDTTDANNIEQQLCQPLQTEPNGFTLAVQPTYNDNGEIIFTNQCNSETTTTVEPLTGTETQIEQQLSNQENIEPSVMMPVLAAAAIQKITSKLK